MMLNATPIKLRSGAWGAKVQGTARKGDAVRITARSGKSWDATVARVVWTGKGVAIVATGSAGSSRSSRSSYSESYCGYPCPVSGRRCCAANGPCHDCE